MTGGSAAESAIRAVLVAFAYYGTARLGYLGSAPHDFVTLWPPSGLMLGLLLITRRQQWFPILIGGLAGSVASDLRSDHTLPFALAAAAAHSIESLAAAGLISWRLRRRLTLESRRHVGEFVIGAVIVSNAFTAILGALVLHYLADFTFGTGWLAWWLGEGLGMLIVAPVLITGVRVLRRRGSVRLPSALEAALMISVLIVVAQLVTGQGPHWPIRPGLYATFPVLLWAGLRFGPAGSACAVVVLAAVTITNAALGVGPFSADSVSGVNGPLQTYLFLAVAGLTAMLPAAVVAERAHGSKREAETENRYRALVEAATDAIVTIDADSIIRFANPAVEEIFGYSPADLIGKPLTRLMAPEMAVRHHAQLGAYVATGQRHVSWRAAALPGLHRDGHEIPLEISFADRMENGQHVFTGIIRDITEKRQAERALHQAEDRMRFALEAARLGTWEIEFATGVALWSDSLVALHGMQPGTFGGTYAAFKEQIHPDDRAEVFEAIDTATRMHTDFNILYRSIWPDGSVHWFSGAGRTFYDVAGMPVRAAGIGLDVTELRLLEEQYRQSQKMEAIGQLAGGIAHDFNNLLTVIQAYGSMLSESLEPGSRRDDVGEILRAADRAAALTSSLLAFSRRQVIAPQPLRLSDSLREMQPMLRRVIGEHIDLVIVPGSDIGLVMADAGQIEQIVMNLALNARDAMPGGGRLHVMASNIVLREDFARVHVGTVPGAYVMLKVSDSGAGMDAETAAHVFEPFFTTKSVGKGTGLGLSTVYGIVKQSGGVIEVDSSPGRGATFTIYLRQIDDHVAELSPVKPTSAPTGTETILVLEDDASLRKLTCRILEKSGYRCLTAETPGKALEIAAKHDGHFDLLLSDVVLPEMSGPAVASQLTALYPHLLVIFMSGYTGDALSEGSMIELGTHFMEKPFTHFALLEKVREVLDERVTPDVA
ncbi:MAG: PAS domain S-box protein [Longimicrobiales bacterium]